MRINFDSKSIYGNKHIKAKIKKIKGCIITNFYDKKGT